MRLGPTAILAVVALAALVGWLVLESRSSDSTTDDNVPVALSADGLATLAAAVPQPIYWVGPSGAGSYELTRSLDRTYVRYLPAGVAVGDPRPFLTVGTYTMSNAYEVMKRTFGTPGNEVVDTPKGGIAVIDESRPTSVYVAYPNTDFQIEIYSPDAAQARDFAVSDKAQPVTATTVGGHRPGGDDAGGAEGARRVARPSDLLGRRAAEHDARADADHRRQDVRPLPPARASTSATRRRT